MKSLTLLPILSLPLLALADPKPTPMPNPYALPMPRPIPQTDAPIPTNIPEDQLSKILSSLSSYEASLIKEPSYSSAVSILATAVPASEIAGAAVDPTGYLQSLATQTVTPSWFGALPTEYQNFFSSVASVEASIVADVTGNVQSKDNAAAGRVGPVAVWAVGLVVGVVGLVML